MKTKIYIVASTNIESTKAFTNPLLAQDYRDELRESERRDKVTITEQEIDVPVYAVTYASHTREDYDDHLHMDDPQIFTSKSEAREEYEGMKRYAENTAANDYDDTGDGKCYTPEIDTEEDDQGNEAAATIKRTDNPLSIYTGRVDLHTL